MSKPIEIKSLVGNDGVLDLRVALGKAEAGTEVLVTIQRVDLPKVSNGNDWHEFVEETYGSCAELALDRQPQGVVEGRETIE